MAQHSHEPQVTVIPPNKEKIKQIWKVFFILLVITIFEFIVAFTVPHEYPTRISNSKSFHLRINDDCEGGLHRRRIHALEA
jgi:hypothetical protein